MACEREIEWYKSIHESQGSVEKTSFGQMKSINQLGHYEIGSIKCGRLTSRSEAIHVRLREPEDKNKTLPQYRYNLDELKDLESKLVLIAGPESSERKNVDSFLNTFHSVCRIADVLIDLQCHGSTEYIRWHLCFSCCMPHVLELLKYQAKKMENDLEKWLCQVKDERDRIYELNYYTTPQLLALREELGFFNSSTGCIKPAVMNLLHGISNNLTPEHIRDVLDQLESQDPLDKNAQNIGDNHTSPSNSEIETDVTVHEQLSIERKEIVLRPPTKNTTQIVLTPSTKDLNLPNPHLKIEDLNLDQKPHLYNLESYGYHESLILLAFEHCTTTSCKLEDVGKWCADHKLDYEYLESESGDSEYSSGDGSLDVDESREEINVEENNEQKEDFSVNREAVEKCRSVADQMDTKKKLRRREWVSELPKDSKPAKKAMEFELLEFIETVELIHLDESHPTVVKLLGLGFAVEQCLEAVDKFPHDFRRAMNYMMPSENDKKLEQGAELDVLEKMRIEIPDRNSKKYMSLLDLGQLLHMLAIKNKAPVSKPRKIPGSIKSGECNLLVVPSGHVLKTTLSLYMESPGLPLPTHEEVLICSEQTTAEEVILLWRRALDDPGYKRIFCLVHAECLLYQVCDRSFFELQKISQGNKSKV